MPGPGRRFKAGESGNPNGRPKVCAELRDLARSHAPAAIEELARLAKKARSETARIAAIRELLDRGFGKATQFTPDQDEADGSPNRLEIVFVKPGPHHEDLPPLPAGPEAPGHARVSKG